MVHVAIQLRSGMACVMRRVRRLNTQDTMTIDEAYKLAEAFHDIKWGKGKTVKEDVLLRGEYFKAGYDYALRDVAEAVRELAVVKERKPDE